MAGSDAAAAVPVEVLVEQHQVPVVRILRVAGVRPVAGAPARVVRQEQAGQAAVQIPGHLAEGLAGAGTDRVLDREGVPVEVVVLFQRLRQQVGGRKPDRAPPVRVPAKQA